MRARAIVLALALLAAGLPPASAADKKIMPPLVEDCGVIGQSVGQAVGIPLSMRIGKPTFPEGLSGEACLLSGKATGLSLDFMVAQDRIDRALSGWKRVDDYDADGPYSTLKGFTRGGQTVVYSLETEPPVGTCQNIVIADCKVPHRQWRWTLEVAAFLQ